MGLLADIHAIRETDAAKLVVLADIHEDLRELSQGLTAATVQLKRLADELFQPDPIVGIGVTENPPIVRPST